MNPLDKALITAAVVLFVIVLLVSHVAPRKDFECEETEIGAQRCRDRDTGATCYIINNEISCVKE